MCVAKRCEGAKEEADWGMLAVFPVTHAERSEELRAYQPSQALRSQEGVAGAL